MIPLAAPFLDVLGNFVIKAALAAYEQYRAQEAIKESERDKAKLQLDKFIIAYKDFMLSATVHPELYDKLRNLGEVVQFPTGPSAGGAAIGGDVSSDKG